MEGYLRVHLVLDIRQVVHLINQGVHHVTDLFYKCSVISTVAIFLDDPL